VFALLTFIADLKGKQSVIFAMEEPEIALPPHTQRRVCRFVLSQMGQAIMTSHSPYVIEQFEPEEIVVLDRKDTGSLTSRKVTLGDIKAKRYRRERRQLAEAVLSRAVLVVEGATETAIFPAASELMENALGDKYVHFDLAGVSVFNAGGDNAVPKFGPFFNALGKMCFAFYDKPKNPLSEEEKQNLDYYTRAWESPENGIEKLLAKETPLDVLTRFLEGCKDRPDYPTHKGVISKEMTETEVRDLAQEVLIARKGDGYPYGALFISECANQNDLPATIRMILETIDSSLQAKS
jgi:putative ATP-dependent endonuclease of OLD family